MTHGHRQTFGKRYRDMTLEERLAFVSGELDTSRIIITEQRTQILEMRRLIGYMARTLEALGVTAPATAPQPEGARDGRPQILGTLGSVVGGALVRSDRAVADALSRTLERLNATRHTRRPDGRDAAD